MYDHFDTAAPIYGASYKDPLPPFDSRYAGRLESILESVKLRATLQDLDIIDTMILYYYKLNTGHPFFNGNKRMSTHLSSVFLYIHEFMITIPKAQLVKLAIGLENIPPEEEDSILPNLREFITKNIEYVPFDEALENNEDETS